MAQYLTHRFGPRTSNPADAASQRKFDSQAAPSSGFQRNNQPPSKAVMPKETVPLEGPPPRFICATGNAHATM